MFVHFVILNVMFYVVQDKVRGMVGAEGMTQQWKKKAEECEDDVKKNEVDIEKLEKKREHEGEL